MRSGNYNMDDPSVQEAIRRRPHEYVGGDDGKHGTYREKPYIHQEYPKMMGTFPRPEYKQFTAPSKSADAALQEFQNALREWDGAMTATIVRNKAEEHAWLKQNS